ncbi:MAG TPA: hypothetical protein VGL69_25445 [Solirubrobacteraceae bacterium]|jgi:hypothetical protein
MSDGPPAYRLDELGWLQFERLCALVLEADGSEADLVWEGRLDGLALARVQRSLTLSSSDARLEGPVLVAAVWISALPAAARAETLARRLAPLRELSETTRLVLTNVDAEAARTALGRQATRTVVLGADELSDLLDRYPSIRAALPAVLGLRDLDDLIAGPARARSSFDVDGARRLARVFWPTRAHADARTALGRHRFVVLTGPPEMGKTAIAQMIALAQMSEGWEAHECRSPDQLWRALAPDRRQVFIADDAFGSTEYRPDAADRWAQALGRLLPSLDDDHWLIWTSRPAPLKAGLRQVQRERHAARFPAPGEVLVDAGDLDLAEKTLILFRHAKASGLRGEARQLVRSAALTVVEHPHFTPERIRRLVDNRLLTPVATAEREGADRVREMLEQELAAPTEAMRTSLHALGEEHRALLVALLDAPGGLIDERELAAIMRHHHPGGLSRPPHELIDRLCDHFVRVTPLGIGWVHPSWRDLIIDELREDRAARRSFLEACGLYGALLALSQEGGATGARELPLMVEDGDWSVLSDRLVELAGALEDRELAQLLLSLRDLHTITMDAACCWEARRLAVDVLTALAARWDARRRPLSAALVGHWYALRSWSQASVAAPAVSRTWAELYPALGPDAAIDRAELSRADEWLGLAQTLAAHDPDRLHSLGFFSRDPQLLARLIVAVPEALTAETRAIGESVLARIADLCSGAMGVAAGQTLATLGAPKQGTTEWWVPEDLDSPPSRERVSPAGEFTRADVARVFLDL